jgi:hypothetical protein
VGSARAGCGAGIARCDGGLRDPRDGLKKSSHEVSDMC